MIGVGRAKQNVNVVDRPLGKGKAEVNESSSTTRSSILLFPLLDAHS